MKRRLYAGGFRYEPPVEIKHAKETSEVFDQDMLLETVYRCDFLLQGRNTLCGKCVAEERHFRRAKDTFDWIQQSTVVAETLKQFTQVLCMLILGGRGEQHVIYIGVKEIQVSKNLLDEPLKYLRGVSKPEGRIREFEEPKRRDDGRFRDVFRMDWNLMVCFYQIFDQDNLLETVYRCDFLLKGPSTLSGNCVAEERHFRRTKDTFDWIQQDTVVAETLK
jgi:hypothetical protein